MSLERILAALHAAVLDDRLWPAASALIDEACGIRGNALLVGSGPEDDVRVSFAQARYRGERRRNLEREYLTRYHPIDERVPRVRQLPDGLLMHITDLYTAEELKTSPTYNEMMPRCSMQDSLNVRLDGLDGSHITWVVNDPVTPGGWEASQTVFIERLLPHIRQYVGIRQTLAKATALGASMTDLLDNSRLGVIQLNRHGRIMAANDLARTILSRRDGLSDRGGALAAHRRDENSRLERRIAAALPISGAPVSGSMSCHRQDGRPLFVVHVTPVDIRQPDFGACRAAALVLIVEPGRLPRIDTGLVARALGLSQHESQVAVWLAEGKTVHEMAEATGRTTGAVYWHLKQIYLKLGISRQVDLARLVLSLTTLA